MQPRADFYTASPDAMKAMMALENAVSKLSLEKSLLELVKLRSSQINGCAFCIDMHVRDALKHGENATRLHLLAGWRDSPLFDERERAALNWAEALTRIGKTHAPDPDYAMLQAQFDETQIAWLTLLIGQINAWNRIQIGLRAVHPVDAPQVAAA